MKHNKLNTRKGFTLVEMLGVLAIIAILISVISVGVLSAINRARIVATLSNFKNLETATLSYIALNESIGKLPLTKSSASLPGVAGLSNTAVAATITIGSAQNPLHLETVFVAAGTLEKYPSWRVGNDPLQNGIKLDQEQGWNRKLNKWSTTAASGATVGTANNWHAYCRAECAMSAGSSVLVPGTYGTDGTMGGGLVNFRLDGSSNLAANVRVAYVVLPGLTAKDAEKISEEINGTLNDMDLRASSPVYAQARGRFVTDGITQAGSDINGLVGYYLIDSF
jgi:prepilin-type N-terminal cleavage/methylation domain-containing protein